MLPVVELRLGGGPGAVHVGPLLAVVLPLPACALPHGRASWAGCALVAAAAAARVGGAGRRGSGGAALWRRSSSCLKSLGGQGGEVEVEGKSEGGVEV